MSNKNIIQILVALIGALGVIIAALITGVSALLVERTKIDANSTVVWATVVSQRTVDAPIARATYTLPPTYTPLPTQQPYTTIPTPKPNVTIVTPKPITVVATPDSSQQNPPPGSIIPAGQGFTKNGVTITLRSPLEVDRSSFKNSGVIENNSNEQIVVRWKNSFVHAVDDKGKTYRQSNETSSDWDNLKQFSISSGSKTVIGSVIYSRVDEFDTFQGVFDPSVKYVIIKIDQLAGMTNMNWRYDIR